MKKVLLLLVAFAAYLHFYPDSEVSTWIVAQKDRAVKKFSEVSDTKVRLSAGKVYRDIESQFASFSSEEQEYVKEITRSRDAIVEFFRTHCEVKGNTTRLHRENQKKTCTVMANYQSFF